MPFERVLVPLDGSRLAEAALPVAQALAQQLGSVLVLTHAVEENPPAEVHGDTHLDSRESAETYLGQQRDRWASDGLSVEVHVVPTPGADVAGAINQLAEQFHTDLVVMCAHGRQTLRGRFLGPIAQRALRGGGPPIMLRTTGASADLPVAIRHILLPVDFQHQLDVALDAVVTLAAGFDASVTLLHAVDAGSTGLPARMLPNTSFELSDRAREDAEERLATLARQLEGRSISVDSVVSTEDSDGAIITEAGRRATDLIILVSHGRTGVAAWYERSVGQRIVREPDLNLLLLREPLHAATT